MIFFKFNGSFEFLTYYETILSLYFDSALFKCLTISMSVAVTLFFYYDENLFAWRCWWYRWFCICICCRLLRVLSMFWRPVTLTRVSAGLLIFWSSTPWHWWSLLYWLSFTDQAPQHEQCSMNFLDWRHNFSDILPGQIQSITILWNNLDEDANKECQVDT